MMTLRNSRTQRGGFTLVELLVAAALTVLVMAILATAFQRGMSTFSHLKSVVTLSEQLRSAESVIRRDLEATHLERETGEPVRVSDPSLGDPINGPRSWIAPNRGFFEIINTNRGSAEFMDEGSEEGVGSKLASGHSLAFTAKLPAADRDSIFYGDTGGLANWPGLSDLSPGAGKSVSPWAELYYFLLPQPGNPNTPDVLNDDGTLNSKGVPLYTLVRRQALPAPSRGSGNATTNTNIRTNVIATPELSTSTYPNYQPPVGLAPAPPPTGQWFVNDVSSLTDWRNRMRFNWTGQPNGVMPNFPGVTDAQKLLINPTYPSRLGSKPINYWIVPSIDVPFDKIGTEFLLPNVISFQIRPQFTATYIDELPTTSGATTTFNNYPRVWDTGVSSNRAAVPVLRGVQLKLRIWDTKNKMTRQMSISVDL